MAIVLMPEFLLLMFGNLSSSVDIKYSYLINFYNKSNLVIRSRQPKLLCCVISLYSILEPQLMLCRKQSIACHLWMIDIASQLLIYRAGIHLIFGCKKNRVYLLSIFLRPVIYIRMIVGKRNFQFDKLREEKVLFFNKSTKSIFSFLFIYLKCSVFLYFVLFIYWGKTRRITCF